MPIFQIGVLLAAMELRILEFLDEDPRDVSTLAEDTGCSEPGLRNLLDALEPLGYVEEEGGVYRLTSVAAETLPLDDLATMAPFFRAQVEMHFEAARGVREAPQDGVYGWEPVKSGPVGEGYQAAMRWLASTTVGEVVAEVDLSPPPRSWASTSSCSPEGAPTNTSGCGGGSPRRASRTAGRRASGSPGSPWSSPGRRADEGSPRWTDRPSSALSHGGSLPAPPPRRAAPLPP